MSKCQCERCSPGNPAPTYTQAFRFQCEARLVLSWSLEELREYLVQVEKQRGKASRTALEDEVRKQFNEKAQQRQKG